MSRIEIPQTAYPLSWPAGVRRSKQRFPAKFSGSRYESYESSEWDGAGWVKKTKSRKVRRPTTVAETRDELFRELERLGAREPVVVSTNMRLRLDGVVAGNQAEPADPGVAVYFKLDGKETCIAIDRFERVADNLRAVAATIDAMRGIERWGGASLVAAAFTGFQGLPGPGVTVPPAPWWVTLGCLETSDLSEIEELGRALSMELHPDKGGDAAKFNEVREAVAAARAARGGAA